MTAQEARELLLAGERIRMVVGTKPADPTLVVWRDEGAIISESIAGWSAGVVEPVCAADSDYLLSYLSGRAYLYRHDTDEGEEMNQDWTKQEAIKAGKAKAAQALALLEEAKSIFHANDQDVRSTNCSEAIEYAREAAE